MSETPEPIEQESSDKELTCQGCEATFLFTTREQRFYLEMGFVTPRYCPSCRQARKREQRKQTDWKETWDVTCDSCGVETTVPFKPVKNRPVYCRKCLAEMNKNGGDSSGGGDKIRMQNITGNGGGNGGDAIKGMGVTRLEDAERPYDDLDEAVRRLCVDLFASTS